MTLSFEKKAKELLVPPGQGVFTVNTAKEHKDELQKKLYGDSTNVKDVWKKDIEGLNESKTPCLLGICSDTGGGIQRGANWGPLFIRSQIYEEGKREDLLDLGDIKVIPHLLHDKYLNEKTLDHCRESIYKKFEKDYPVSPLSIARTVTQEFHQTFSKRPLFCLGGDHSVSYPIVKSFLQHKKKQGIKVAIIHFDAHTDLLKERLGIDLCFGSWCTHILDELESPSHLIQLGIRSSGKKKEYWEKTFGVKQYWAHEIKKNNIETLVESIKDFLESEKIDELYLSFDIDALDESIAGATGTPEPDGLTTDECAYIMTGLFQKFPLSGADLVEVAPFVNAQQSEGKINPEPNSTLLAAGALSEIIIKALNRYAHS